MNIKMCSTLSELKAGWRSFGLFTVLVLNTSLTAADALSVERSDLERYAHHLELTLNRADYEQIAPLIDREALLTRAVSGEVSKVELDDVGEAAKAALDYFLVEGNHWHYLRTTKTNIGSDLIFRVDLNEGGVTYFRFKIEPAHGAFMITDWFDYATGLWLNEKLLVMIPVLAQNLRWPQEFVDYYAQGRFNEAYQLTQEIESPKSHPILLPAMRLQMAPQMGEKAVAQALLDVDRLSPEQHRYALMLIDYFYLSHEYDQVLKMLSFLEEEIGQDAAVYTIRAAVLVEKSEVRAALRALSTALSIESDYEQAYWTLLAASMAEGNAERSVAVLELLKERFLRKIDVDRLSQITGYDQLIHSKEFVAWRESNEDEK